jgi:hypothetical protein
MTLAKRHIQRLWYPAPGHGGAIASRAEHSISTEEFNRRIPNEFWREVVDRCAAEAPHTLLLAEAFWMMEGYFVRTLGMHRVYNSAFMNMLKNEENSKYRATIKNTLEFDPEILKRFVNFMNNPDEETAVAQFGKGDKYFGICTLLVTMPGLPMFGHGQIEGFEEKYGMEYRRAYRDEQPDGYFVDRHEREIFPLMKRRALFSGSAEFRLYDLYTEGGSVDENVFAYSNRAWIRDREERALIFYNNSYYSTAGWIKVSDPAIPLGDGGKRRDNLNQALALHDDGLYFTLFREQHSNLWYIRSSKAIGENGFFVALNGYETQVFIDIHEVQDDQRGRWARLHHELQGRAVSDPHSAIKDIFLGDLYYRLTKLLKPEIVSQLHGFFTEKQSPPESQVSSFIESMKESAEKYFASVTHFIGGADGKYDPWVVQDDGVNHKFEAVNSGQLWDEFKGYVERLAGIAAYLKAAGKTPAERLLKELAEQFRASKLVCAATLGYGLLAILRSIIGKGASGSLAANLAFEHWDLDRKLKDQYRTLSVSGDDAAPAEAASSIDDRIWRLGETSRAVLRRTAPYQIKDYTGTFDARRFAAAIIEKNYLEDDFRSLIGINRFNDVTWFNKEAFESALFYGKFFFTLEGDSAFASGEAASRSSPLPWLERVGRIAEISEALKKAEADSGYQLDNLIQLLTTEKTSKPKTSKPKASEPKVSKPKASEPKASEQKTSKPKASEPKTSKPKTSKPKTSKPKASAPKTSKPKASAPKASKPKASGSKTSKPKASAPKASEPKASKPKTSTPKTKSGKKKG